MKSVLHGRVFYVFLAVIIGVFASLASLVPLAWAVDPTPQGVVSNQTISLVTFTNVTSTTPFTGLAVRSADYGLGDCYASLDMAGSNTTTVTYQHSPDAQNWVSEWSLPVIVTTGVKFTRTAMLGNYTRFLASPVLSTVVISGSVQCKLLNSK